MDKKESQDTRKSKILIKGGQCLLPDGSKGLKEVTCDILLSDGIIQEIGSIDTKHADEIVDASHFHVLPGLIDSQVHFREPGLEHKEDLESGTRAALLGGITAVFEMPNTNPGTTNEAAFNDKIERAKSRAWTDFAFFVGATPQNIDQLATLEKLPGCVGIKIFMGSSTGQLLVENDQDLLKILSQGQRRVAVHCEDEQRLRDRKHLAEESGDVQTHPIWRDEKTALTATQRLIKTARETKRPVHVLHVTTAEEMEFLKDTKDIATVECTPQHLTLSAPECYERLGSYAQMNPPIRSEKHRQALWRALKTGIVDVIGSDHAPHTREEKQKPYPQSPSGMPGVQTLVPVMLTHVNEGRLSLSDLVKLTTCHPTQMYGVQKQGSIVKGQRANLTLVDMKKKQTITNQWIASKCGWTPFDGFKAHGWPVMTIVGGEIKMRDGEVLGGPTGQQVTFSWS